MPDLAAWHSPHHLANYGLVSTEESLAVRLSAFPLPFLSDLLFPPFAVPLPQFAPKVTQSVAHSCSMIRPV